VSYLDIVRIIRAEAGGVRYALAVRGVLARSAPFWCLAGTADRAAEDIFHGTSIGAAKRKKRRDEGELEKHGAIEEFNVFNGRCG
jgi:hypothetical protein